MTTKPRHFDYGVGALAVVAISIGVAAIVYGMKLIPLDIYNLPAWILGPLGVYTIIYSVVGGGETTYYLVWGTVMTAVAVVSGFYNTVNIYLTIGIVVILLAVIGVIAYMKGKK